jgi:hypothetical protein
MGAPKLGVSKQFKSELGAKNSVLRTAAVLAESLVSPQLVLSAGRPISNHMSPRFRISRQL